MMDRDAVRGFLREAKVVCFQDWPRAEVPAAVVRAGMDAVGHEPDSLKRYTVEDAGGAVEGARVFELADGRVLVTRDIEGLPATIDVVSTFRPPEEQVDIARDAIAKGAKVFWVEPGEGTSEEARAIVEAAGMVFVDGVSIVEVLGR